ncbi:alpha/beta-hydrolase [Pseudohyphozyma bogoriensis]|nr:alpha/beta-hydrolase [Pseudohyphozyma bogoriensis]
MHFLLFAGFVSSSLVALAQAANLDLYPDSTTLPYAVHLPPSATKQTKLPAIVFLHGSGSAGPKSALSSNVLWDGVGQLVSKYDGGERTGAPKMVAENYLVVLPLSDASGSQRQWYGDQVNDVLKDVQSKYNVDPARIHISGYSMGGKGSWTTAINSPGTFAALITSAGFSEISSAVPALTSALLSPIVSKKIAIKGFAGTSDDKQPVWTAQPVFDILSALGANAELEQVQGADHSKMSIEPWMEEGLWTWLEGQKNHEVSGGESSTTKNPITVSDPTTTPAKVIAAVATTSSSPAASPTFSSSDTVDGGCSARRRRSKKRSHSKRRLDGHGLPAKRREFAGGVDAYGKGVSA